MSLLSQLFHIDTIVRGVKSARDSQMSGYFNKTLIQDRNLNFCHEKCFGSAITEFMQQIFINYHRLPTPVLRELTLDSAYLCSNSDQPGSFKAGNNKFQHWNTGAGIANSRSCGIRVRVLILEEVCFLLMLFWSLDRVFLPCSGVKAFLSVRWCSGDKNFIRSGVWWGMAKPLLAMGLPS